MQCFFFKASLIIFVGIGVSSPPMAENNKVGKTENKLFYIEAEKDLFSKGLVWYFVNMGYGKVVEQFTIPELYNEPKLEFVAIKVTLLVF
jgi:hypothetical protein